MKKLDNDSLQEILEFFNLSFEEFKMNMADRILSRFKKIDKEVDEALKEQEPVDISRIPF